MTNENSDTIEMPAEEVHALLDRAEIGAMILMVNDMMEDLKGMLATRPYNSRVAIAAAELNQARRTLEEALKSLERENTVGLRTTHEVDGNVIRLRIEEER